MSRNARAGNAAHAGACSSGASNLLTGCVGARAGERIVLVEEDAAQPFYCPTLGDTIAEEIAAMGARGARIRVPPDAGTNGLPPAVIEEMAQAEHVIFLNRLGDYLRFLPLPGECTKTICYALDRDMLASSYASVPHALMSALEHRLEEELEQAQQWRITCPLGTDIRGSFCWPSLAGNEDDDFSASLFPVTTFKPVPCDTANGQVRLSRWLVPGGAARVEPAHVAFDGVVRAEVRNGTIGAFDGPRASVEAVRDHYERVAGALRVNRDRVHSWHAGMNPRTSFAGRAEDDLERWGAVSFASPRYLHFHTCGDVPPAEITWSVFNPTVWIDGAAYWRAGEFVWLERPDNRALIESHPAGACLLEPASNIGV